VSILLELISSLFVGFIFEFIAYVTGALILFAASLGSLRYPFHSYSQFKALKEKSHKGFITPSIIGFLFYVLLIILIAWLN